MSLLYLTPGVFLSFKLYFNYKPPKDAWVFLDKVYYLEKREKVYLMVVSYLLCLCHYYILVVFQRMEVIGLNVMLEQEDLIVTDVEQIGGLKSKSESAKKIKPKLIMEKRRVLMENEEGEVESEASKLAKSSASW